MGDENVYNPRECVVRKRPDFQGYGFNLHAERGKAGQYIGKVDPESPAEAGGLKEGDRIVEVNGVNIGNENHSQVVERIRKYTDMVTMLVVDNDTDKYFKDQKVVVKGDMSEVIRIDSAPRPAESDPPSYNDVQKDDEEAPPTPEPEAEPEPEPQPEPEAEPDAEPEPEPEPEPVPEPQEQEAVTVSVIQQVDETPAQSRSPPRLCKISKRADFQGYGFNLHAEKDKTAQYIGIIDANSPAEESGLLEGDRIVEVNGENIEDLTHSEAIGKIKAIPDRVELLVVDREADDYYKNNGIKVHSGMAEVKVGESRSAPAPQTVTSNTQYIPRECHIIKWPDFNGYGFNLHAEKPTGSQYIGKIDDGSPAQDADLRDGDRIIAVNGVNVEQCTHQQVIEKIKAGGNETKLLVVDKETDQYYKSRGITVSTSLPEVKFKATARRSAGSSPVTNGDRIQPTRSDPAAPAAPATNGGVDVLGLGNMSAKEMRERLTAKKKHDAKSKGDFRTKYEIFQKL